MPEPQPTEPSSEIELGHLSLQILLGLPNFFCGQAPAHNQEGPGLDDSGCNNSDWDLRLKKKMRL